MRSARILALASAFLATAPAFAQDNFPDVPANHWAYEALSRMKKDGLLVGYPDGLYRGSRPASRYELAVAMHAVYTNLKAVTDGLDAQVRALDGNSNAATLQDAQMIRDAVAALQQSLAAMKGYGADIADLQRASLTFEKELTQLGVDVQAMKDDLKSLSGRVAALEAKKPPLEISGELDVWLGGGHGLDHRYGLSRDGRLTGVGDKLAQGVVAAPVASPAGITDDLSILHEAAVTFASTNATGVRFEGTLVATNAFGQNVTGGVPTGPIGFGNQSDVFNPASGNAGAPGLYGYGEGTGDVYLQKLAFLYSGKRVDAEFGRVEHKATPWILQRIDNTLYFDNERWDNGKYLFDGAVMDTHVGPIKAQVYGGRKDDQSVKGVQIQPLRTGPVNGLNGGGGDRLQADQLLGGTLTTSVKGVALRGDYLVVDATTPLFTNLRAFDHLDVYGGEADFHVGRFKVEGGLRQTKAYANDVHIEGLTDSAWDAKVGWAGGRFDLVAQYRQVGFNYLAPGDWGRLGILRNPTNVRGFLGSAKVDLAPRLALGLEGELSKGLDNGAAAAGTLLDRDTDIHRYAVNLDWQLARDFGVGTYFEETRFEDLASDAIVGVPQYRWYGVRLAYGLSSNATFSLNYEQSAIHSDYQTTAIVGNAYRGGFLTSQVTVKF